MKRLPLLIFTLISITLMTTCFAFDDYGNAESLGDVSQVATGLIFMLTNLAAPLFFMLGMGFTLGAITRFRYHYKNPSAAPLTTPVIMAFMALIMFGFNVFNHWKQEEVFGRKKPPVLHVSVPDYKKGDGDTLERPLKTPIQVLREIEQHPGQQTAQAPATSAQPQVVTPVPQPNQQLLDDPDFDEEYTT